VCLIGLAALVLLGSACSGGPSGPGVTGASSSPSAQAAERGPIAFAACMRSHGVPNFPDPPGALPAGLDPNSPRFVSAQSACQPLDPQGSGPNRAQEAAERQKAALVWAACLRSHGVPNFPDPSITAQGGHLMVGIDLSKIDLSSPQFLAAQKACQGLPGRLPIGGGVPVGSGGSGL
jgi:hypothetical protein